MIAHQKNAEKKTVRVRIKRQERPDASPHWEEFDIAYSQGDGTNITSVLQQIAASPSTVDGRATTPVAYDAACLEEVCGSCTMVINGRVRQACSQLIDDLLKESPIITLEPMAKFPVIRDLTVDRQRLFHDLKKINGWVPIDGSYAMGAGPQETPQNQDFRYRLSRCMSCGCCLDACPQYTADNHFVGAAVIGQVSYFNRHETGKQLQDERLDAMMEPGGIGDCGNAQNCVKVCPKGVPLTEAIAEIGRTTTLHVLKNFFRK